jgi:hypothetical protein
LSGGKRGKPTTRSTAAGGPEIDKHFADDRYGHLNRHEAKRLAREQADYLWQQQYGRY